MGREKSGASKATYSSIMYVDAGCCVMDNLATDEKLNDH